MRDGRSLNAPRSRALWMAPIAASYWRKPFLASAAAFSWGSVISSGSSVRLSRRSRRHPSFFALSKLFGFPINHFARDQFVLEMGVAIDETAPLPLPVFRRRLGSLGGLKKLFQIIGHRQNIGDSNDERHGDF